MINLEDLYFEWLLTKLDPDGVTEEVAYVCDLLHRHDFLRRVGLDINRAADGAALRKEFLLQMSELNLSPHLSNDFLMQECTWLEMLIALAIRLDFMYEGGVEGRFTEMIDNLGLGDMITFSHSRSRRDDEELVAQVTSDVDNNRFDRDGRGGIFPLRKSGHSDQRRVEIWDQHAAYFREKLEGVLWTSTT